jgi:DNA-directed RNA polymerase beta' subunit
LYEKKALQETLLAKQIAENKKIEAMLESWRQSEEIYRIEKNNIQEKINAYIHNKTIKDESLFTQELETPKTSNKKTQENISEQVLKQELWLLTE